jgi:hypothetical protein
MPLLIVWLVVMTFIAIMYAISCFANKDDRGYAVVALVSIVVMDVLAIFNPRF